MTATPAPRPLAQPLRSAINKLAHQAALQHETLVKADLTRRLTEARDAGATLVQLREMLTDGHVNLKST